MLKRISDGVGGLIVKGDKILLCHRRDYDMWNLPLGGIKIREDIIQALKREVKEETGLKVLPQNLVGVYQNYQKGNIILIFLVKVVAGKLRKNEEVDELNYFDYRKLPHSLSLKHRERIIDYFKNFRRNKKVIFKIQKGPSSIKALGLKRKK